MTGEPVTTTVGLARVVTGYALRACLPRRPVVLLLPLVGSALFGFLARFDELPAEGFANAAVGGIFGLVVPITCLVVGDAVLGAEIRSGTFAFTWLSPAPVRAVVAGRWAAGALFAVVTLAPAAVVAAIVAGVPSRAPSAAVGVAASAVTYVAVFVAFAALVRRAVVWSLVFTFFVERVLGGALSLVAGVSPGWLGAGAFLGLSPGTEELERELDGVPDGWAAVLRLAVLVAVALALTGWRLRRRAYTGEGD